MVKKLMSMCAIMASMQPNLSQKLIAFELGKRRVWQLIRLRLRAKRRARERALRKRVPRLSTGSGQRLGGLMYGRSSNYGRDHNPPISEGDFLLYFRFASKDIERLCQGLRVPTEFKTKSGCKVNGEEAFLFSSSGCLIRVGW